jgi:hypothetical protein
MKRTILLLTAAAMIAASPAFAVTKDETAYDKCEKVPPKVMAGMDGMTRSLANAIASAIHRLHADVETMGSEPFRCESKAHHRQRVIIAAGPSGLSNFDGLIAEAANGASQR